MNAPNPPASEFKDRRNALLIAGIIEIVMGVGAWLLAGMMMLGMSMAAQQGMSTASMLPGLAIYGGAGTLFMVLGIGSIRLRRWARSLWLVISVGWLVFGVIGVAGMFVWMPAMMASMPAAGGGPPPEVFKMVMLVTIAIMSAIMLAIPLSILLFYRSPHVRATIETAQPYPSWTDRCTLPTLGAVIWLGTMAVMMLAMPGLYGGLFPLFGMFIRGPAAYLFWLGIAAACGLASIGLYRRNMGAWWLAVAVMLFMGTTGTITYAYADLKELYLAMGLQGQQLEQLEKMGFTQPVTMAVWTVVGFIPMLLLILWARPSAQRLEATPAAGPPA